MLFASLALWALLIAGAVLLFNRIKGNHKATVPATIQTPLEVLKVRFARGEISSREFEEMKNMVK